MSGRGPCGLHGGSLPSNLVSSATNSHTAPGAKNPGLASTSPRFPASNRPRASSTRSGVVDSSDITLAVSLGAVGWLTAEAEGTYPLTAAPAAKQACGKPDPTLSLGTTRRCWHRLRPGCCSPRRRQAPPGPRAPQLRIVPGRHVGFDCRDACSPTAAASRFARRLYVSGTGLNVIGSPGSQRVNSHARGRYATLRADVWPWRGRELVRDR